MFGADKMSDAVFETKSELFVQSLKKDSKEVYLLETVSNAFSLDSAGPYKCWPCFHFCRMICFVFKSTLK